MDDITKRIVALRFVMLSFLLEIPSLLNNRIVLELAE